jgi:hypothetical protein
VASVKNAEGFRLSVSPGRSRYSADCRLDLPEGWLDSMAREELVTVQVDGNPPLTVLRWQEPVDEQDSADFLELIRRASGGVPRVGIGATWVSFRCWPALKDQRSPVTGVLREMLDGVELRTRFATASGDEMETSFSLAGARELIAEALDISAVPSTRDVAQAELLKFRFDYRSNTCYLLAGRKRQKRCLETVRRCAERTHDSVLSMAECVEGK